MATLHPGEIGRILSSTRKRRTFSRPIGMPEHGCFSRPVTHHHIDKDRGPETIHRIEVWSAPGKWCIRMKSSGACFHGATELAAWTASIKAIDADVEVVRMG